MHPARPTCCATLGDVAVAIAANMTKIRFIATSRRPAESYHRTGTLQGMTASPVVATTNTCAAVADTADMPALLKLRA
jgi:hypothetical protein